MNVFNLAAKLSLDSSEFDKGLSSAKNAISNGLKTAAKVGTAAIAAASTGIAALVKQSVEGYSKYEQLVGGVDTLFKRSEGTIVEYARSMGKTVGEVSKEWHEMNAGADTVMKNAAQAFKTAGLSANEYMETVTSFSASLLQSLGGDTKKAADYADMAIRDMSDNANKMGTAMESIQSAYQGFAKQNYTMLDNLKLGYGGTKSEMERLVEDAEKLNSSFKAQRDENGDLALSYADIVDAIHIVQDEMNITGTTAREASTTIEGSLGSLKAAWENLVTGFGNKDADLGALIDDVVQSAETALENLAPVITRALKSAGKAIGTLAPVIGKELPGLIADLAPDLLSAGIDLVIGIGKGVIDAWPDLLASAETLIDTVLDKLGIKDTVDEFMSKIAGPLSEAWEQIKASVTDAFERIKEAISPVTDAIGEYVTSGQLMEDTTNFISTAVGLLADGISLVAGTIATVVEKGREFVDWLTGGSAGAEAFKTVVIALTAALAGYKAVTLAIEIAQKAQLLATEGLTAAQKLLNMVMEANPIGIIIGLITALVAAFIYLWNTSEEFRQFWIDVWEGIKKAFSAVVKFISGAFESIAQWATEAWENIKEAFAAVGEWFSSTFTAAKEGIVNAWSDAKEKFSEKWENIKEAFSNVGSWFSEKFQEAKENALSAWSNIKEKAAEIWGWFKDGFTFGDALQWGKDMIQNFLDGITQKWEDLKEGLRNIGQTIKDFIGFSEPKYGPLSNFHTFAPDMMKLFAEGIKEGEHYVTDQIADSFDFADMELSPTIKSGMSKSSDGPAAGRHIIGFDPDMEGFVRYLRPYIKEEDDRIGDPMVV